MGEPSEGQLNGAVASGGALMIVPASETIGSKRQRRPSVRLGDIGGDHHHHHQQYDSHVRRITDSTTCNAAKQFKLHHVANVDHKNEASMSSKLRALTNLNSNSGELNETLDENLDCMAIGSWKLKDSKKRGSTKRVRTNWLSKNNQSGGDKNNTNDDVNNHNNNIEAGDSKYSDGEDLEDGFLEFNMENLESPSKERSPVHSLDNLGVDGREREDFYYSRKGPIRGSRDHNDGVELSGPSDNDAREWNRRGSEDGVRIWLNSLGLGRYAPVFKVHEVDDEVLPQLTLEDLKDIGISAVGSRRKMYCAIQKLSKGFS